MDELLRMQGITKQFPGVMALDKVDLELYKGEVLAVLGENGAGKSTLLKILSGVYTQDSGDIFIEDKKMHYRSPVDALLTGVSIIYQELNYYNDLTVAENIYIGRFPKSSFATVNWNKLFIDSEKVLNQLKVNIDPHTVVRNLSTAEKQLVEIARAISQKGMKILVMDEPTSALSDTEVESLLTLVRNIAETGIGVIFISHRLDELFKVADRVQVLRDGKNVGEFFLQETTREELVHAMVGRDISAMYPRKEIAPGKVILEVKGLTNKTLKDISFNVHASEILGVFGLMGAGRTEMCQVIFGASSMTSGEILVDGKAINSNLPSDAMRAGIAYVPNERKTEGLILCQTVKENLITAVINKFVQGNRIVMDRQREKENAEKWVDELSISTPNTNTVIESLSGGNQQKVVLGKWLETKPKVILLNEPTRGIDVGAKVEIYKIIEDFCEQGMAVVLVSSEQTEIMALTDRCIVLCEGRLTGMLKTSEYSQERLMHYAIGGTDDSDR
ncbi:MAG: sugar ABC transporter ATP-binding protein [Flexilinea sp.]